MLLSELRPIMRALVPSCPNPLIDMALVDAARELCRHTNAWRYELESGDLSKEGSTIVMSAPTDTVILRPYMVEYGDSGPLIPATKQQLSRKVSATWRDDTGEPSHFVFKSPNTLFLYPWLSTIRMADLTVTVALMPALGITEIDDQLAVPYSEVIRNGALSRLMLMPKRGWSDAGLGIEYAKAFAAMLAEVEEAGTDAGVRNLPRKVRYGGY